MELGGEHIRTLHFGSHESEGEGTYEDCQDDVDDLASVGMPFVNERGAKAER